MASRIDSHVDSDRLPGAHGSYVGVLLALVLAATSAGGAWWLSAVNRARPWDETIKNLATSGKACLAEGDAAAHAAARVARSQTQLESYIRDRFEQFRTQADLAEAEWARSAAARKTVETASPEATEIARIELRLAALNSQRVELLERLTAEHPAAIDVSHQIIALEKQLALAAAQAPPSAEPASETPAAQIAPTAGWKGLVDQTAAEYLQLAAACRRAERDLDDAQVGESTALDRHVSAIERLDEAAAQWDHLAALVAGITWILWFVSGVSLAALAALVAKAAVGRMRASGDRVITSVRQLESWFSLPVVALSDGGEAETPTTPSSARGTSRWLVLPAQLAMAAVVFLLVVATIQNPSWPQDLAIDPWQTIGQLWGR